MGFQNQDTCYGIELESSLQWIFIDNRRLFFMSGTKQQRKKITLTQKQKTIAIIVAAVVVAAVAIGLAVWGIQSLLSGNGNGESSEDSSIMESSELSSAEPEDLKMADGVTIAGVDVSGKTEEEALALLKDSEDSIIGSYKVTVTYQNDSTVITEDDLAFTFDFTKAIDEAAAYSETISSQGSSTQKKDFPVEPEVSYENVETKLDEFTKGIEKDPVDATIVSFDSSTGTFSYADGKNGLKVDHDKLYEDVLEILKTDKVGTVEVPTEVVEFDKTKAEVAAHMQKLGTFSTYSTNTANGNHNMKLALAAMNGTILQPGAVFSFNGTTGDTTNGSLGYLPAGAIANNQSVQAYGGGICQASTTLYGAVIRSDLEIVTRYNHLWPSSYVPIGQDATVDYPGLDFQFRNSTDYPIYIQAGMSGTKLTVTLYGDKDPSYDYIEVTSQKTETIAMPSPQIKTDSSLSKGDIVCDNKGNAGSRATATKIYYKNGAVVKTESLPSSYYRPVAPVYRVGPGTNTSSIGGSSSGNSGSSSSGNHSSSSSSSSSSGNHSSSSSSSSSGNHSSNSSSSTSSTSASSTESTEENNSES